MRVRKSVITAAIVAASAMSWTRAAAAQGAAPATPPGVPAPSLMRPQGTVPPDLLKSTFTPKVALDAAWTQALQAVLDGMKHLVLLERAAAAGALPAVADVHYVAPPPAVPSFEPPGWKPLQELREAFADSPVQPSPIAIGPPTESGAYTQGEHAVLLGLKMDLPWRVP